MYAKILINFLHSKMTNSLIPGVMLFFFDIKPLKINAIAILKFLEICQQSLGDINTLYFALNIAILLRLVPINLERVI